ncbi:MAG: prepilin-type N-terminal cleavage/methylation domain-containing protein [Planctomycetes bacterium]|nr:prepilin-type N-terminal cleavage/methylation domain-containing protein [Planctomycetota bacterium]
MTIATRRSRADQGFTLIELMVSLGLGVVLLSMIAFVFDGSQTIMKTVDARLSIRGQAGVMLDLLERDLQGMAPPSVGQRFQVHDFNATAAPPLEGASRSNPAWDRIQFRTYSTYMTANGEPQTGLVHVFWGLVPEDDPSVGGVGGSTVGTTLADTPATARYLFVLRRRAWPVAAMASATGTIAPIALGVPPPAAPYAANEDAPSNYLSTDVGNFIYSMNISIMWLPPNGPAGAGPYGIYLPASRLILTGGAPPNTVSYPVGDGIPANSWDALPYALQFVFRMTEGAGARQERIVQRIFVLPRFS